MNLIEISKQLKRVLIDPNAGNAVELVKLKTQEIINNDQAHGRSEDTLRAHVRSGAILELTTAGLLNGKMNSAEFDYKNPMSYMFDIEVDGELIEIKSTPYNDTWFNFNIKGEENPSEKQLSRNDLTTFLKHSHKLNYIIVGSVDFEDDRCLVRYKMVADAKNFSKHVKASGAIGTAGTPNYFHHKQAINARDCVSI